MANTAWLQRGTLRDDGADTAVYPYFKLRNILKPEDARAAVLEETRPWEQEFGRALIEPFYRLVWTLNTGKGVCTSHTNVSPPDWKSPFSWARYYMATAVITLSRKQAEQHDRRVAEEMVQELGRALLESLFLKRQNTKGWLVTIMPVNINVGYETLLPTLDGRIHKGARDYPGYGSQIIVSGSASSRRRACERWSASVSFIVDTLHHLQTVDGQPAQAYDHFTQFGKEFGADR